MKTMVPDHELIRACHEIIELCKHGVEARTRRIQELQELQAFVTQGILAADDARVEHLYRNGIRDAITALLGSSLRDCPPSDKTVATKALTNHSLSEAFQRRGGIARPVIATMLIAHAYEFDQQVDIIELPRWLRAGYLRHQFASPQIFFHTGDAAAYASSCAVFAASLHRLLADARDRDILLNVIGRYLENICLLGVYFNDANLADLYRNRGRLTSYWTGLKSGRTLAYLPNSRHKKLRLGLYAPDWRHANETPFAIAQFGHVDRAKFEVIVLQRKSIPSPVQLRAMEMADFVVTLSDDPVVALQTVRDLSFDALCFCNNLTVSAATDQILPHHRVAPLQIATAASPVTTGLPHVDLYLMGERNEMRAGQDSRFTEKVVAVPGSITVYPFEPSTRPQTTVTRSDLQIPEQSVAFFSGANAHKIIPELSKVWAQILARVPDSVLVLMPFNPNWSDTYPIKSFAGRLSTDLSDANVDPKRLIVLRPVRSQAEVQAIVNVCDVYLDPFPFGGACSMYDPLWVGVPPVAYETGVFRGSVGSSMLSMMGLDEFIAKSIDEYIDIACALANSPERRAEVRSMLIRARAAGVPPYADARALSRKVGTLLERVVRQRRNVFLELEERSADELRAILQALLNLDFDNLPEIRALTDSSVAHGLVEPFLLNKLGAAPGTMLDVGACLGEMSRAFVDAGWEAHLFEPDPEAREALERTYSSQRERVLLVSAAVTNADTKSVAFFKAKTVGLSGCAPTVFGDTVATFQVPTVRLRDYCQQKGIGVVDYLKVDAEGFDFDALESLDFERLSPTLVFVEFHTRFRGQLPGEVEALFERMSRRGYDGIIFVYSGGGNWESGTFEQELLRVRVVGPIELSFEQEHFGNILFYRKNDGEFLRAAIEFFEPIRPRQLCLESLCIKGSRPTPS
jgi:FkbM family methyltransferase